MLFSFIFVVLRFNRYMVECKYGLTFDLSDVQKSFNRYMVECKYICPNHRNNSFQVLIDTWWNVNINITSVTLSRSFVLIDTWWNVNLLLNPLDEIKRILF